SEMGTLFTHSRHESFEEVNVIKRNDGEDVADFLYLKHKPSEEIMKFFISEMTKMRRQHDVALQEKTEELFRLKREFHKEKGTVPFRKDKEFELVSDAASKMSLHSSLEATLLKQVKNLKGEVEDLKVEGNVKDVVDRSILRGIFNDYSCFMEDIEIQNNIMQVTYSILLQGVFCEALSPRNPAMQKYFDEKASLKETLLEKEKVLSSANEENQRMKQETTSLSVLINEKDQLALEARSSLIQQKEQYDIVCHDPNILRDQVGKQEKLISDFRKDSDSMKTQLDEAFQQVLDYELEISKLKQDLNTTTNALDEAEKQNLLLCGIVEEKQRTLSSSVLKDKEQVKWLECSMFAMAEMSKAFDDFKNKMQEKIRRNENRCLFSF
ncbi:WPP domain-associated protein, partial [Ananas comosus]